MDEIYKIVNEELALSLPGSERVCLEKIHSILTEFFEYKKKKEEEKKNAR